MIDLVKLTLIAGDGGHGKVSFRREKYVPKGGPDGGDGGQGGAVVIQATKHLSTLKHLAGVRQVEAKAGGIGGKRKKTGEKGQVVIIKVPLGTVIWVTEENQISAFRRQQYGIEHVLTRGEVEFEKYYVQKPGQSLPPRNKTALDVWQPALTKKASELAKSKQASAKVKLIELTQDSQQVIICQGGFGGRGNIAFKASTKTTPLEAEYGTFGEKKTVILELKLLADVGLVGLPNAGKSTLLSRLTKATPKIANYPFTTLEPHLGVMELPGGKELASKTATSSQVVKQATVKSAVGQVKRRFVTIADIPGLIEGASEGKGLGLDFLRHIENCQVLLFVLFLKEEVVFDQDLTNKQKAELVWRQFQSLQQELHNHHSLLMQKPMILSLNKIDIYTNQLIDTIVKFFKHKKYKLIVFSGITGEGLEGLKKAMAKI